MEINSIYLSCILFRCTFFSVGLLNLFSLPPFAFRTMVLALTVSMSEWLWCHVITYVFKVCMHGLGVIR